LPFYDVLNQSLVNMPAKKTIDRGKWRPNKKMQQFLFAFTLKVIRGDVLLDHKVHVKSKIYHWYIFRQLQKSEVVITTNSSRTIAVQQNDHRPVSVHKSSANRAILVRQLVSVRAPIDVRAGPGWCPSECLDIRTVFFITNNHPFKRPDDHCQMTVSKIIVRPPLAFK
jgi:hypothetical protein